MGAKNMNQFKDEFFQNNLNQQSIETLPQAFNYDDGFGSTHRNNPLTRLLSYKNNNFNMRTDGTNPFGL